MASFNNPPATWSSFFDSLVRSLLSLVFARLYTPQNPKRVDLSDKTAIVTGANSGIGLSISTELARQGATVYLACRNPANFAGAIEHIVGTVGQECKDRVFCWKVDIGDLEDVRNFCSRWASNDRGEKPRQIDILVHNAGIVTAPLPSPPKVKEGNTLRELDKMYTTNFLGSFLMTHLLEPHLSPTARIVLTSSTGHYGAPLSKRKQASQSKPTSTFPIKAVKKFLRAIKSRFLSPTGDSARYAQSKAYQVAFAKLLQHHFTCSGYLSRSAHSFTPGFTSTPIFGKFNHVGWKAWFRNTTWMLLRCTENSVAVATGEGAKTGWWLASTEEEIEGGGYWEWGSRRVSLVDRTEEEVLRGCWEMWERDAGVSWEFDRPRGEGDEKADDLEF